MVTNFIGILASVVLAVTFASLIIWIGCMVFRVDLKITKKLEDIVCCSFLLTIVLIVVFNFLITP